MKNLSTLFISIASAMILWMHCIDNRSYANSHSKINSCIISQSPGGEAWAAIGLCLPPSTMHKLGKMICFSRAMAMKREELPMKKMFQ